MESPYIFNVTEQNFIEKAVEASKQAIVIVDFWAQWCGPCKMLGPLLENIVNSYEGRVLLAKVDVDANQALSTQFGIKSIPTVKFLKDGKMVHEFVGALGEPQIRAILDQLAGEVTPDPFSVAENLLKEGRFEEAGPLFQSILDETPDHSGALIGLARIGIIDGDSETARSYLDKIEPGDDRYDEAQALTAGLGFIAVCHNADDMTVLEKRIEADSGDLESLFVLGCCQAASGNHREALEAFLAIVKKDRAFEEGKAQEAMKSLFEIVGQQSELTSEYRGKLAMELF